MVFISNMDTSYNIWYLPSESNHVRSTNGKVGNLLIIMLITVRWGGTVRVPNRTVQGANSKLKWPSLSSWSVDFGVNRARAAIISSFEMHLAKGAI